MVNPELSRLAARLFNEYRVPTDKGLNWAAEIETAKSKEDLSTELKEFLEKPYYINPKPEKPQTPFGERMNDASEIRLKKDGKWFSLDTGKEVD